VSRPYETLACILAALALAAQLPAVESSPPAPQFGAKPLPAGKFGGALDVPAHSVKELPEYKAAPLTAELWCKLNSSEGYNILLSNEPKASSSHWSQFTTPGWRLAAYLPGFNPSLISSAAIVADGQWHYVAMVFDGQSVALFADGREVARGEVANKPDAPGPLSPARSTSVGRRSSAGRSTVMASWMRSAFPAE
jgi:hypothetical protein